MSSLFRSSHAATLDRLLNGVSTVHSLKQLFGRASDEFWLWAFTEGYRTDERLRQILPAFPPEEVQLRFTGAAGDQTMQEAFGVYSLVRSLTAQHLGRPLESVLEFGCGWGRVIRLFLRDVEPERLQGIDCMPAAIEICKATNPYCQFTLIDPFPPTALPDASFDLVYLYSVFSHLSEDAHLKWLAEFHRILKPGGLVVATTRPRDFILYCAEQRAQRQNAAWAQGTVQAFKDTKDALARYDRGEFLYEPLGGGDVLDASFFGETCIPQAYVRQHWTRLFEFVGYLDDRRYSLQNVIVVRK
jgi:ubiquinone/menaquinone biosynthesis C-methylase UbiE